MASVSRLETLRTGRCPVAEVGSGRREGRGLMSGLILLGQVAEHLITLEIVCNRCERKGRAAVDRLMTQHGSLMSIPTLLALLSGDCPKRQAANDNTRCAVPAEAWAAYKRNKALDDDEQA
jgi:hypothetical protein